ncbi:MAG: hypothetical protein ACQEV6_04410 [Pseudomonadota bacterium]
MALMSKTQARINIKGGLQIIPQDEQLNALNELIQKAERGGRNSVLFKGVIWLNIIMTIVMIYMFMTGNLVVAGVLAFGAVPMWIQGIIMLVTTGKNGSNSNWLEAAYEVRQELESKP